MSKETKEQLSRSERIQGTSVLVVMAILIGVAVFIHWQWAVIWAIGLSFAYGMIKFGWDVASAAEKKAKE